MMDTDKPKLIDLFKDRKLIKKRREIELLKLQVEEAKIYMELKEIRKELDK